MTILLESKIIAVADVFEAMTSHRAYKAKLLLKIAFKELMNGKDIKYCSKIVDACLELFETNKTDLVKL